MAERDTRGETAPGVLYKATSNPLRIMSSGGISREARTPMELAGWDSLEVSQIDPQIVRVHMVDESQGFPRDLFISYTEEERMVTMTGYLFSGRVSVYAWNRSPRSEQDKKRAEEVKRVQMEHVEGYDNALARHQERIQGKTLFDLSLEDGLTTHQSIVLSIPK